MRKLNLIMLKNINIWLILLGALVPSLMFAANPTDERLVLCMSEDPTHHYYLNWRSTVNTQAVEIRIAPNLATPDLDKNATILPYSITPHIDSSGHEQWIYQATLGPLEAGQSYAYQIYNGEMWSEWIPIRAAMSDETSFRFIYFGDPQNGLRTHVSRSVRQAFAKTGNAAFFIFAGDLVGSPYEDDQWNDFFYAGSWLFQQIPQVMVAGNHGYKSKIILEEKPRCLSPYWRPHFNLPENGIPELPETNYTFVYQGARFIILNSCEQIEAQAVWLDEVLSKDESSWQIITWHHPMYSSARNRPIKEERKVYLDIFDRYDVDLILQGHEHTYARTHPMVADGLASNDTHGTVYMTSVSGSKQYPIETIYPELFVKTDYDKQLYQVISVSSKTLKVEVYSLDGECIDNFTLNKHTDPVD